MGLLDDAIREHLELKRKHGANPDDVARQEQEALGPGQRNEFAQPEGAAQAPPEPAPAAGPEAAAPSIYEPPTFEEPAPVGEAAGRIARQNHLGGMMTGAHNRSSS